MPLFLMAAVVLAASFSNTAFAQPTIGTLAPPAVTAGNTGFTLTLTGTGFCDRSIVSFNGANHGVNAGGTSTAVSVPITAARGLAGGGGPRSNPQHTRGRRPTT